MAWIVLQVSVWLQPFPRAWFQQGTLSLQILDRDGHFLYELPAENKRFGAWLPEQKLPPLLKAMTIAAEDHRLASHPGVDPTALLRALVGNLRHQRRISGASTLAMQLVRQFRPAPRTYRNKIIEMYWALVLQHHLGPDGVLREYLNRAPYGNRVQGIHRAALLYFDRPTADLSLAQAAFLTALPWAPGTLNPFRSDRRKRAWKRAKRILRRARTLGFITPQMHREALRDTIRVQPKPRRDLNSIHFTTKLQAAWTKRRRQGREKPVHTRITTIRSTIDLNLQRHVASILQQEVKRLRPRGAGTASVVVLDHRSGEILAHVGSAQYFDQENRGAIDFARVERSPGSTLKPFLYLRGIEKKQLTGASLLSDMATGFLWKRGAYHPQNYDARYFGPLRMRVALGNSRNIPALRALSRIGVVDMLAHLRSWGFSSLRQGAGFYGLGLALGSGEVSLFQLVRAYGIIARQGRNLNLVWARQARDSLGRQVSAKKLLPNLFAQSRSRQQLMSPNAARLISQILADPVARLPSFRRHGSLEFSFPVAVKTGTSQGFRDAWTIGFSDRVVVGCWLGNHDRRRMKKISGTRGCGGIFKQVMIAAMRRVDPQQPALPFPGPRNWRKEFVCPLSGLPHGPHCPGKTEEWFPQSHKHKHKVCPFHIQIAIDKRNGLRAGPRCQTRHTTQKRFVRVPAQYGQWAKMMGFQLPPFWYSSFCPPTKTTIRRGRLKIQIQSPLHRARYVLDPTTPTEFSTIALRLKSNAALPQIVWYVNGKELGRSAWPYTLRWTMKRGIHHFVAMTPDHRIRTNTVTIFVR